MGLPPFPGGAFLGLRSPSLGKVMRPGSRTVASRPAAWEGNSDYLVLTGRRRDRDRLHTDGWTWPPQCAKEATSEWGNSASLRNAIPSLASHQIHSEVSLDTAALTKRGA